MANSSCSVSVATSVANSTTVSCRLERTISAMWWKSSRPQATTNRIPAIAGIGRYSASGARNRTISSSQSAENTAARGVFAPAV
jgi:hypothetical protein